MNNIIEQLSEMFQKLPGIGPRQAKRFIFSILEKDKSFAENFASLIRKLRQEIARCPSCFYVFEISPSPERKPPNLCHICRDNNRDEKTIMVTQKEIDLENVEKSRCYNGKYFVLGGNVSFFNKSSHLSAGNSERWEDKNGETNKIRLKELFEKIKNERKITEIILALSADRESDATAIYINKILEPFIKQRGLKISRFGKGLSSGAEIEYIDKDTIQNSFLNRK